MVALYHVNWLAGLLDWSLCKTFQPLSQELAKYENVRMLS